VSFKRRGPPSERRDGRRRPGFLVIKRNGMTSFSCEKTALEAPTSGGGDGSSDGGGGGGGGGRSALVPARRRSRSHASLRRTGALSGVGRFRDAPATGRRQSESPA